MAATNSVFANDTSITLDWADVSGADRYTLQVSETPDFSGTLEQDDATLAVSTKAFTDGGTNNTKRWWRWRYSKDTGTTWSEWSDVGSYWLNTGGAGDVALAAKKWAMFDPDTVTDIYTLTDYPKHSITDMIINRFKRRNRAGTLLSEYLTTKARISFEFNDNSYMPVVQMRAFKRFNCEIKTFFLACYRNNGTDNVPNIWKVQIEEDGLETMMVSAGREDYYTGTVVFEEV